MSLPRRLESSNPECKQTVRSRGHDRRRRLRRAGRRRGRGVQKNCPTRVEEIAAAKNVARADIEIWFADEARIGQKNKITRRWARRGSRPSAPHDQRTASTYIFGAICPSEGKGAALVLPHCHTQSMSLHLAEIATEIAPGSRCAM